MGTKYTISYNSIAGDAIQVAFQFSGYAGAATVLTGGPSPVVIEHEFNIKEFPAEPVTDTKMTINISLPTFAGNFYEDITDVQDGDCWVVYHNLTQNIKQSGWLIPDESHRKFNTYNYDIALTVISPLSFMKNKTLLADDGKMLYDKHSIGALITTCLKRSLPAHIAPVYNINAVLNDNSGGSFTGSLLRVEGFNSSDGRPPSCYDVLKAIASSFACKLTWLNDVLHIENLHHLAGLAADRSIVIKAFETDDFLIGNTEDVTKVRGVGEVSIKYDYGFNTGILRNGRFYDFSGLFADWDYKTKYLGLSSNTFQYNTTTVQRFGSGRTNDPYRARIKGLVGDFWIWKNHSDWYQGLAQKVNIKKGDMVRLRIRFKYKDWRTVYGVPLSNTNTPFLAIGITQPNPQSQSSFSAFRSVMDEVHVEGSTTEFYSAYTDQKPSFAKSISSDTQLPSIIIGMASSDGWQVYEKDLGEAPFTGELRVMIFGVIWAVPTGVHADDIWVDISEVIVSTISKTEGTKSKGEEHYITNNTSFKPAEQKELKIANFFNEGVAGSLMNPTGSSSSGYNGTMLQRLVLMQLMALSRSPRYAADIDVKSRGLKPTDLLELHEGLNSLLPDKYLITRMVTDTKTCEHTLQVYQLKSEDKGVTTSADPSATVDLYETFKIYGE